MSIDETTSTASIPSTQDRPTPVIPPAGGKHGQVKRDYAKWYDQYLIDMPKINIAD